MYALSYPAITGGVVTEGHAQWCRTYGHGKWIVDGVNQGICPRCGDVTDVA